MKRYFILIPSILLPLTPLVRADTDTWLADPVDNGWTNLTNWSLRRVPNGSDTSSFGASAITDIVIEGASSVGSIVFQPEADAYTVTAMTDVAFAVESFLENDSSLQQNFVATADGTFSSGFSFSDGAYITGPVMFTQQGATVSGGQVGYVNFFGSQTTASAGTAIFHNLGGSVAGGGGGQTNFFYNKASAANATVICDGATVAGAAGGSCAFAINSPDAGNAILIANGGSNGGGGGSFLFEESALGETARLEVFGNGYMDCSGHNVPSFAIGSIEGDGQIYLGNVVLVVGSNSLSTTFSGVLHPGNPDGDAGSGGLTKSGLGNLTLTGANLFTAGTTVTRGQLIVSNRTGSGTGPGPVTVNSGTLGGSGVIAGTVIVGTGGGMPAFLAPAAGTNASATLTIQSSLTFNSKATYTYTFRAKRNRSTSDKVVADGVTINSGATFNLSGKAQGALTQGTVFTVIKNTAAAPISGTFSNLADGAIVSVNGNNFQASYEGGDGNDLTLTVVP